MPPSWPPGTEDDAKAWEKRGHLLHYVGIKLAFWECWTHYPDPCDAVRDGTLMEPPA